MEYANSDKTAVVDSCKKQNLDEGESRRVTAADLQRAHTRVTVRLGEVVCDSRDVVSVEQEL